MFILVDCVSMTWFEIIWVSCMVTHTFIIFIRYWLVYSFLKNIWLLLAMGGGKIYVVGRIHYPAESLV